MQLIDGNLIQVPDSLHSLTAYVIAEQGDWFEDEIRFVRILLGAGERVIDIGANYGAYTLSMARSVGPQGRVWAIEPASATASNLRASVELNDYAHVVVCQYALGERAGKARLSLHDNAELNGLVIAQPGKRGSSGGRVEQVRVMALDEFVGQQGIREVGFVKLDAEGAEGAIIAGAETFLATESPLIQYEAKEGKTLHLDLADRFRERGYRSYRLIPGLNVLIPFDGDADVDAFLLNLYACKPDRAEILRTRGLLVDAPEVGFDAAEMRRRAASPDWLTDLTASPYAHSYADPWQHWQATDGVSGSGLKLAGALALFHHARNPAVEPAVRVSALHASLDSLRDLTAETTSLTRLATLARVAREAGAQTVAVKALRRICNTIQKRPSVSFDEPFVAPTPRFDDVVATGGPKTWLTAAALEAYELNCAFSSYFTGPQALGQLRYYQALGYPSEVMAKRLKMIERRFPPERSAGR
ncbi:MAG: FkbM family methyltransferase [Pseudomonadota bacterium]